MSTRRLPVILFVFCLVCLWWPRRFIVPLRPTACQCFTTFKVFYLLSSSRGLHRLSNNLAFTFGVDFFFFFFFFLAPSVFSPLLSLLRWLDLYVLAAGHHLWLSGCNFGDLSGAPSCLGLQFLHLRMCLTAKLTTKFVYRNFKFGRGLYAEAGILEGSHVWVCGSGP